MNSKYEAFLLARIQLANSLTASQKKEQGHDAQRPTDNKTESSFEAAGTNTQGYDAQPPMSQDKPETSRGAGNVEIRDAKAREEDRAQITGTDKTMVLWRWHSRRVQALVRGRNITSLYKWPGHRVVSEYTAQPREVGPGSSPTRPGSLASG